MITCMWFGCLDKRYNLIPNNSCTTFSLESIKVIISLGVHLEANTYAVVVRVQLQMKTFLW